jgi:transposase-like protein
MERFQLLIVQSIIAWRILLILLYRIFLMQRPAPQGLTLINANIGFHLEGDVITYFHGHLPVFRHEVDDHRSFRMIISQLYINGSVKQSEICRAFGIAAINVKRGVKLYREKGIAGFYQEPRRRGAAVLKPPVLVEVQGYLDQGEELAERGVFLGKTLWIREIRKLTESGHQTAIISTDYQSDCNPVAAAMFARWSQENFFRYMRRHYNLDGLADLFNRGDI